MPFTAAHTVAVLPFIRSRKVCASALVAGSMAPDFEYFIRINVVGIWGHNIPGIFLFDLPITLVSLILFHTIIKKNFINNLPSFIQRRFGHLRELTLKEDVFDRPVTFSICACIGAATHVFWDGFTHQSGYFVRTLTDVYEDAYVPYGRVNYPLWYALQHISTWIGMTILFFYVVLSKPKTEVTVRPGLLYWIALFAITAVVVFVRFQFPHRPGLDMWAIASISGLCIGVIFLGLMPGRKEILPGGVN